MSDVKTQEQPSSYNTERIPVTFFTENMNLDRLERSKGGHWKVYWAEEINSDLGGGPQMETISLFSVRAQPTKKDQR